MIKEIRKSYEACANTLSFNWEKSDKSELIRMYTTEGTNYFQSDYVLSAIICRYWNIVNSWTYSAKCPIPFDDAYNLFVDTVRYVLSEQVWNNPDNKLYNSDIGPDVAMNVTLSSRRYTYFQSSNRFNRKINHETLSWESLVEDCGDAINSMYSSEYIVEPKVNIDVTVPNMVKHYFDIKDYFKSFLISVIAHEETFERDGDYIQFSPKKALRCLTHWSYENSVDFANRYGYDVETVDTVANICNKIAPHHLKAKIIKNLQYLRYSHFFKELME